MVSYAGGATKKICHKSPLGCPRSSLTMTLFQPSWQHIGALSHCLRINYYVQNTERHRSQWNSAQMNNRHPWQLKKSKSCRPFWSYLVNSTANPTHFMQKLVKGAELFGSAVWQLQKGLQDFNVSIAMGAKPSFQLRFIVT